MMMKALALLSITKTKCAVNYFMVLVYVRHRANAVLGCTDSIAQLLVTLSCTTRTYMLLLLFQSCDEAKHVRNTHFSKVQENLESKK